MRRWKHTPWYIQVLNIDAVSEEKLRKFEEISYWSIKRTKKSAGRHAQRLANKTGEQFAFFKCNQKHCWVCDPEEKDCFLEML